MPTPQGSILCDDVHSYLENANLTLFADDMAILASSAGLSMGFSLRMANFFRPPDSSGEMPAEEAMAIYYSATDPNVLKMSST
jgi:hypothetical protein